MEESVVSKRNNSQRNVLLIFYHPSPFSSNSITKRFFCKLHTLTGYASEWIHKKYVKKREIKNFKTFRTSDERSPNCHLKFSHCHSPEIHQTAAALVMLITYHLTKSERVWKSRTAKKKKPERKKAQSWRKGKFTTFEMFCCSVSTHQKAHTRPFQAFIFIWCVGRGSTWAAAVVAGARLKWRRNSIIAFLTLSLSSVWKFYFPFFINLHFRFFIYTPHPKT